MKDSKFSLDCINVKLEPLYKRWPKTKPKNSHPVSFLRFASQVLEKVFHKQTEKFRSKNKILYKYLIRVS